MISKFRKGVLLLTFFISYIIYLSWRAIYTIPLEHGIAAIFFGCMLFMAEIVGFFESIMFYITLWDVETPTTPDVIGKEFPDVDIFVSTYNEPLELLYKTIIGCKNMDYPEIEKVHIYICDDGNRSELAVLCKKMNVNYITRTENTHAKAGNMNNALVQTNSPYIVTFDADMIPMSDFLIKTIPFFLHEDNVGFVQVPQNFYNPDSFQYNLFSETDIPNEQNLFSRLIQAGKSKYNAIIYAGSNTVISRKALDEIGGFVVGTITEDFATGMMIQDRGYKTICLNEVHASGLSPDNLEDMYNQRIRWGRGVIQTFKKFNPLKSKNLNIMQKIMYLSAVSYWYFGIWRFIFFISPIVYSVFNITVLFAEPLSIITVWLPMYILTQYTFTIFTNNTRNTKWSHIYDTIMFPQITIGAILETIGLKMTRFKVTPKDANVRDHFINKYHLVWVQIVLAVLSVIGLGNMLYSLITIEFSASYLINIFWLSYNSYLLIMAIFFSIERPKFRTAERMSIDTYATIKHNEIDLHCVTHDISETGLTIVHHHPIRFDTDKNYTIKVITDKYLTEFTAQIINAHNFNGIHKYAFKIHDIDETNYQQLILVLYDRVPNVVMDLKKDKVVSNIKNQIKRRLIK